MKICRFTGYRDILAAATNDEVFSSRQGLTNLQNRSSLLGRTKPGHLWLLLRHAGLVVRAAWSNALRNHGRFAELRPAEGKPYRRAIRVFLEARGDAGMLPIIEKHLDGARRQPELCLCRDLAWPCTEEATREMLGLPAASWTVYREPMLRFMTGSDADPFVGVITRIRVRRHLEREIRRQRSAPVAGGLIDHLLRWQADGRRFSDGEIAGNVWMVLGGFIGTEYFLSSALHYFAENPVARRRFLDEPGIRDGAIEELLRYFTPGTQSQRLVSAACVAGGERYEQGDVAILDWAAGNFDGSVFESPESVDFDRSHKRHLSFGAGAHYCLGAGFARQLIGLFLTRFLEAFPDYRIDVSRAVSFRCPSLAGFEALPANLHGAPVAASAAS